MQKTRKFFSALLAGFMLFSMIPVNAEAYNRELEPAQTFKADENKRNVLKEAGKTLKKIFFSKVHAAEDDIARGEFGGVTWVIDAEGTLTLSPTDGVTGQLDSVYSASDTPWYDYRNTVKKIYAEQGVIAGQTASGLFCGLSNVTEIELNNLDVSKTRRFDNMFGGCRSLTTLDGISEWDLSQSSMLDSMFQRCTSLTSLEGLRKWNVYYGPSMELMFYQCTSLTSLEGLEEWETHWVLYMDSMFSGCTSLVSLEALSDWDVGDVIDMQFMFSNCSSLPSLEGLEKWSVKAITRWMFSNCTNLMSLDAISSWTPRNSTMNNMFQNCKSLTTLNALSEWDINGKNISYMFSGCSGLVSLEGISKWRVDRIKSMEHLFSGCSSLSSLEGISEWNISSATNLSNMFSDCSNLVSLDGLEKWDVSKVTNMSYMFKGCKKLVTNEPVAHWKVNNANASNMFQMCECLEKVDFKRWSFSSVYSIFQGCSSLAEITVSSNFNFTNSKIDSAKETDIYTGNWTFEDPWNHEEALTSTEFASGTHNAGTWLWERKGERPPQYYVSNSRNIFMPEYIENEDGSVSLKQTPEEIFTEDGYWKQQDDNSWIYTFYVYNASVRWYIWEDPVPEGYISSATKENPIVIENEKIVPTITNTADSLNKQTGGLMLYKTLVQNGQILKDPSIKFPFKVTLKDEDDNPLTGIDVYDNVAFNNGVAYVQVGASETKEINDIPAGYHAYLEELPDTRYEQKIESSSGVIRHGSHLFLSATNTETLQPERTHGNLTLRKTVTGNVDTDESFNFLVAFDNLESETTYTYGDKMFTSDYDGSADIEVSLKNGEEITFDNLPADSRYRILEEAGNYTSSYTITDANNLGMINQTTDENEKENEELATATEILDKGENITVEFTNDITKTQNINISKVVKDKEGQILANDKRYEFTAEFNTVSPGTVIKSELGLLKTDDNGHVAASFYLANGETIEFTDIPVGTQYRFAEAENSAIASYKITDSLENQSVVAAEAANDKSKQELATAMETVDNGEDTQIEFTNTITNGSLTITKMDTNNEPLMGAEFTLTDTEGIPYTPKQTTTNSEGIIKWEELPLGTYTLTETKAPAGSTLMKEPLTIEITSKTPDVEISITDNSAIFLDAGGAGMTTVVGFSSASLALTLAIMLNEYRKKKYSD